MMYLWRYTAIEQSGFKSRQPYSQIPLYIVKSMVELLKYAARISEAREQHQSKFAFDLGELERQMDEYYNVSRLPI
jgi:hypothetical protein